MKNKKLFITLGVVFIALVGIVLLINFSNLSIINTSSIDYTTITLNSNQNNYIELGFNGIRNSPETVFLNKEDCINGKSYFSFNIPFTPQRQKIGYPNIATAENYWLNGWNVKGDFEWVDKIEGKSFDIKNSYINGEEMNDVS